MTQSDVTQLLKGVLTDTDDQNMYKISLEAFVIHTMTEHIINLEHLKDLRLTSWVRRSKKKLSSLVMGEL